jgi:methylated-DNA-protein-cysteine methyltransferase-like protein
MSRAELVRQIVRKIPKGRVATYGQVATLAGMKGARAVGSIIHTNQDPVALPCHRVVNAKGHLASGYALGGPNAQRKRLEAEGIYVQKNDPLTIDLTAYGWNPGDTLRSSP